MKQAEADRLAACCFSVHGKDEFRTVKPVSCLNCWIFLLPRTGIQMKQEPLTLTHAGFSWPAGKMLEQTSLARH